MIYKAIKNNKKNIKVKKKSKYVTIVELDGYKLRLTNKVTLGKVKIERLNQKAGNPNGYNTEIERRNARNVSKRDSYNKTREKYRKDIQKTPINIFKADVVEANKIFYNEHYLFSHFITPQQGFVFDKHDKKSVSLKFDYDNVRNQDKYQIKKIFSKDKCIELTELYLKSLVKNGKLIYDNYYYVIHKSHYDNSYHPHITINVIDKSIKNVHTFCSTRWGFSTRKKGMVKKIFNLKEAIGYMQEEKKRLNDALVYTECNIDSNSHRILSEMDLTVDLQYSINTYTHPETKEALRQFAVRRS
ncbi:hypothetical protein [Sphingobacterium rhinopitheci]|uniref:hypothetical protein n=1 Tax=Sphingobacterium rhinopitheci TaxID=2781960 RepID=UPI001F5218A0|nr:hypothetical protein [Sphingobacterium rhinopitheci]MCI0922548.1 hypothetical protein [Sphingobacterium rhinopitheci]